MFFFVFFCGGTIFGTKWWRHDFRERKLQKTNKHQKKYRGLVILYYKIYVCKTICIFLSRRDASIYSKYAGVYIDCAKAPMICDFHLTYLLWFFSSGVCAACSCEWERSATIKIYFSSFFWLSGVCAACSCAGERSCVCPASSELWCCCWCYLQMPIFFVPKPYFVLSLNPERWCCCWCYLQIPIFVHKPYLFLSLNPELVAAAGAIFRSLLVVLLLARTNARAHALHLSIPISLARALPLSLSRVLTHTLSLSTHARAHALSPRARALSLCTRACLPVSRHTSRCTQSIQPSASETRA